MSVWPKTFTMPLGNILFIPQNAVSPRPRKARCNLVARIDRPWSPSFRSAMQKVTLEQQIEQKSHAQRTAMLEKVQRPKDDRAVQRMGIEWCQCCALLGSSIHRFKTRHQSDYEGHEQTSLILLRMMSPRTSLLNGRHVGRKNPVWVPKLYKPRDKRLAGNTTPIHEICIQHQYAQVISDERAERRNLVNETLEALLTRRPGICEPFSPSCIQELFDGVLLSCSCRCCCCWWPWWWWWWWSNCGTTPRTRGEVYCTQCVSVIPLSSMSWTVGTDHTPNIAHSRLDLVGWWLPFMKLK